MFTMFKTRAAPEKLSSGDEITNILIFGITGLTGGALMEATVGCAWFRVNGFSRAKKGRVFEDLVAKGVNMFTGDMNKPQTLKAAMKNIDTVFLVTSYWDTRSVDIEYSQGVNVINMAIENDVKHLICVGSDYAKSQAQERCRYLEGKSMVENYIVSGGIPFTIIHMGFYFENFLSVFKPHRVAADKFALALPMGQVALNCGSVYDFGCCIGKMALNPTSYLFRTIELATSYMTVSEIASKLDGYFQNMTIYDPQISIDDYRTLQLAEITELSSMFVHYRTLPQWDRTTTYDLYPTWRSFEQWIADSDKDLVSVMTVSSCRKVSSPRLHEEDYEQNEQQPTDWLGAFGFNAGDLCTILERNQEPIQERERESNTLYSQLLFRIKHCTLRGAQEAADDSMASTSLT